MDSIVSTVLNAELEYGTVDLILSPRSAEVKVKLESKGRSDLASITHESSNDMLHVTCSGRIWTWGGFDLRYS